ncbi:MAG: acetyl-CoA carboxylase biotin carboxylase subunit [Bacteroidetes bacterium]|nr:acetyl-CoA carboxylase biotin carboxylase subunit [Bacteroidota bacterium]
MKRKPITKILIANRGEIAVRIHRSASEMGIRTVAVYSDPDRTAPHVLFCDEAYPLHGTTSAETYLDIGKLIRIAKECGADAVHPGYGFLSEKAEFARAVIQAGLTFIGPAPETIDTLGSKTSARDLLAKKKIPIVPGTTKPINDLAEAHKVASSIGYPVLIKAAGGGGGKGMRRVDSPEELEGAIERARNEASKAFSDDRVYIEKFIINPKHIEIQVLADTHGNVIHLGERECSVQRRHQKVVEECPSIAVTPALRNAMGTAAVEIAKAAGYVNAGTMEFLLDASMNFYFLEVNTRVQVEHPITEMVYGIDIVREQIRIAQGEPLSMDQASVVISGHAIEARIYAEEYDNNFLPSTGTITHYQPSEGPGVRNDSGVRTGSEITMYYDPMIAKLVVHGRTREEAVARMKRALREYKINGVKTTIPFCEMVLYHPEFIKGTYDINFVAKHYLVPDGTLDAQEAAAIGAAFAAERKTGMKTPSTPVPSAGSPWKVRGLHE